MTTDHTSMVYAVAGALFFGTFIIVFTLCGVLDRFAGCVG